MPLYAGIETLAKEGDSVQWGGPLLGADGFPAMPDGRARFSVCQIPRIDVPAGKLVLTTRRGKQFNSMTHGTRDPLTGRRASRGGAHERERHAAARREADGEHRACAATPARWTLLRASGPCRDNHVQAFWPECNPLLARGATIPRPGSPTMRPR